MTNDQFQRLLPSERYALLEAAVAKLARTSRLVTFTAGLRKLDTYALVAILDRDVIEYVTYLVAFKDTMNTVYFVDGNYGFMGDREQQDAIKDMFDRAFAR
jgi:hypothetical protein